jgi:hypothetical protein
MALSCYSSRHFTPTPAVAQQLKRSVMDAGII